MKLPRNTKDKDNLIEFIKMLMKTQEQIGFKLSARGWGYELEGAGLITKAELDKVENLINYCRKNGVLPVDFTAEEEGRIFSGIEIPEDITPIQFMGRYLSAAMDSENYYTPDWWEREEYYIQMLVEKIDLKSMFEPICRKYHIPIATSKGWSSILQRAEYTRRFKQAEERGLKCILLYCGDHDPDGLRISDTIRKNLYDIQFISWGDGGEGYNPKNLIIDRFGLNYDFIINNELLWIDNLITGSGRNLADPNHKNYHMDYVQDYLRNIGKRKCEANAILKKKVEGRELCKMAIEKYIGTNAIMRFRQKRLNIIKIMNDFRNETGINDSIKEALDIINKERD